MKLKDFLDECSDCEIVFLDGEEVISLEEGIIRQFKRVGNELKRRYRCLSGPKAGKLVADPASCATRKDPRKVRHGRKVMRSKKGTIQRKSKITKKKYLSKLSSKLNKKIAGK